MGSKKQSILDTGSFRLLVFFMDNPYDTVYLREAAKKIGLSPSAVKKYADLLLSENLIVEERRANLRYFKSNIDNPAFRHFKIAHNLGLIEKSGLIKYLVEKIPNVSSVVLFGSMARGENDKGSDLDLLVIGSKKQVNLTEYQEKIMGEINMHNFSWGEWKGKASEDRPFHDEVIMNGIPLFGEMPQIPWK